MSRLAGLLIVASGLISVASVADDRRPSRLLKGWGQVVDPDDDCPVKEEGGKLMVHVPGKAHDFASELGRWNAPRVLSTLRGDFVLEVKVGGPLKPADQSTIEERRPYVGAGLLLVKDTNNFISLHRGTVYLDGKYRRYANFELRRDAEMVISRSEIDLDGRDTYLRLERRGKQVFALASQDGFTWKSYEPIDVDFPDELKGGVVAVSSSKGPFTCSFEGLGVYYKMSVEPGNP